MAAKGVEPMSKSNTAVPVKPSTAHATEAPAVPTPWNIRAHFARALSLVVICQRSLTGQNLRSAIKMLRAAYNELDRLPRLPALPLAVFTRMSTKLRWLSLHSRGAETRPVEGSARAWGEVRPGAPNSRSFHGEAGNSQRPVHVIRLLTFLRNKRKSPEDAEDLIQEAMLRLHVYGRRDAVANEESFLRRILHHLTSDHYRRDRYGSRLEAPIDDVDQDGPLIAPNPTPEQILESQQRLKEVTAVLDAVSPRTREIYIAHRSGYSYAEISAHWGISEITIKRHIARALLALMEHPFRE
jgi:RNA polymerase sigma factor (sigma-70 family)